MYRYLLYIYHYPAAIDTAKRDDFKEKADRNERGLQTLYYLLFLTTNSCILSIAFSSASRLVA